MPMRRSPSRATDLVMDRLPPVAELSLRPARARRRPSSRSARRSTTRSSGHTYQPDVFFDYEPHLEYLPNPYAGFRAYLAAHLS